MASYDPYQYSLARAQVVGNTVSGIERAIVDTASKISVVAKQKDADKKIKGVYDNAVNRFVEELMQADPVTYKDNAKARIAAMRRLPAPMSGLSTEDNLKNLLSASTAADKYLEDVRTKATTRTESEQMSKGAQTAVAGRQTPVTGFTEDAGPVMNQEFPATTQEQALSRVGEMSASKEVPQRTSDQWRQQPVIAALPKTPEPEKPLTSYQKWYMKFKEDEAKRKSIEDKHKEGKDAAKDRDENVKWAATKETDYLAGSKSAAEKASKLKQAIIRLKTQVQKNETPILEMTEVADLRGSGYEGETDLQSLEKELDSVNKIITSSKIEAKKFGKIAKDVAKGGSLSKSYTDFGKDQLEQAYTVIKNRVAPGYSGSVDQLLSWLPEDLKPSLQSKIEEARNAGHSDSDIVKFITSR